MCKKLRVFQIILVTFATTIAVTALSLTSWERKTKERSELLKRTIAEEVSSQNLSVEKGNEIISAIQEIGGTSENSPLLLDGWPYLFLPCLVLAAILGRFAAPSKVNSEESAI